MKPKLLICEEGLRDEIGHWFEYCKSVVDMHEARGVECVVAIHAAATPVLLADLPARPVFRRTSWDGLSSQPNPLKRYFGVLSQNWLVFRTVRALVREEGPFDVVFAPTVTIYHLIGWRALAALYGGSRIKRLVVLFRNNAGAYSADSSVPRFRRATGLLAILLRLFKGPLAKGVAGFATDSERLADEYELLCGIRPEVYPSPRIAPPIKGRVDGSNRTTGTIEFSCLGPARLEKGIDVLQAAIALFLARRPAADVCFTIQWNQAILLADGHAYLPDPGLTADPRVRLLTESLDSEAYDGELARTQCMILPYRRESYYARISGVAVEGATAGIPIIYTADTWCENLVTGAGAGIGVADGDAPALADAIARMVDEFPAFQAAAMKQAESARALNSADTFVRKLWGATLPPDLAGVAHDSAI